METCRSRINLREVYESDFADKGKSTDDDIVNRGFFYGIEVCFGAGVTNVIVDSEKREFWCMQRLCLGLFFFEYLAR